MKKYKVLFDNGGIPMRMSFDTKKEADEFADQKWVQVIKKEYPKEEERK